MPLIASWCQWFFIQSLGLHREVWSNCHQVSVFPDSKGWSIFQLAHNQPWWALTLCWLPRIIKLMIMGGDDRGTSWWLWWFWWFWLVVVPLWSMIQDHYLPSLTVPCKRSNCSRAGHGTGLAVDVPFCVAPTWPSPGTCWVLNDATDVGVRMVFQCDSWVVNGGYVAFVFLVYSMTQFHLPYSKTMVASCVGTDSLP